MLSKVCSSILKVISLYLPLFSPCSYGIRHISAMMIQAFLRSENPDISWDLAPTPNTSENICQHSMIDSLAGYFSHHGNQRRFSLQHSTLSCCWCSTSTFIWFGTCGFILFICLWVDCSTNKNILLQKHPTFDPKINLGFSVHPKKLTWNRQIDDL